MVVIHIATAPGVNLMINAYRSITFKEAIESVASKLSLIKGSMVQYHITLRS